MIRVNGEGSMVVSVDLLVCFNVFMFVLCFWRHWLNPLITKGSAAAVSWLLSSHCLQERVREEARADQASELSCSPKSEHMIEQLPNRWVRGCQRGEKKEATTESRRCRWNAWESREGEGRCHSMQVRVTEQSKEMLRMLIQRERKVAACQFSSVF